ncbi:hypothetical protein E4U53_003544 [Claviceps sorghi]|nr:hypothetical protein E4U53_003544 [Claviceps sorghi]
MVIIISAVSTISTISHTNKPDGAIVIESETTVDTKSLAASKKFCTASGGILLLRRGASRVQEYLPTERRILSNTQQQLGLEWKNYLFLGVAACSAQVQEGNAHLTDHDGIPQSRGRRTDQTLSIIAQEDGNRMYNVQVPGAGIADEPLRMIWFRTDQTNEA